LASRSGVFTTWNQWRAAEHPAEGAVDEGEAAGEILPEDVLRKGFDERLEEGFVVAQQGLGLTTLFGRCRQAGFVPSEFDVARHLVRDRLEARALPRVEPSGRSI
jgi:hypothetical protein